MGELSEKDIDEIVDELGIPEEKAVGFAAEKDGKMEELREKISEWFNTTSHDMGKSEYDVLVSCYESFGGCSKKAVMLIRNRRGSKSPP